MLRGVINIAAAIAESPSGHSTVLWSIAIIVPFICTLLFAWFLGETKEWWKPPSENGPFRSIARERAEKSCDTVLSVCALLIPATLGLITWLNDKVGPDSYVLPLGCALFYFFALLAFTIHLRFNFFWRCEQDFLVSSKHKHNLRFAYWLTTATSAIVLGLILLSVPVVELGLGWLKFKPAAPPNTAPVKVEVTCNAPGPPLPPPLPCKRQKHHRRSQPPCSCPK